MARSVSGPSFLSPDVDLDTDGGGVAIAEALSRAVGHVASDAWCLIGLDPASGLRTFQFSHQGTERTAAMARNEAKGRDVNHYGDLVRAKTPAGWLAKTHPHAGKSFRFNEILRPQGYCSELRLVLRRGATAWGALVLFRGQGRAYDDDDAERLARAAGPLTEFACRHPVRRVDHHPSPIGSGAVLVAPDDSLTSVSASAQRWLDDLVPGGSDGTGPGDVQRVLFDAANAVRRRRPLASACIRTISGRWLHVEGAAMPDQADIAVFLHDASPEEILGTVSRCHALSPRENDVLRLLARGHPTQRMAHDLEISAWTVNDHLQSIYRKCQVRGRDELLGSFVSFGADRHSDV